MPELTPESVTQAIRNYMALDRHSIPPSTRWLAAEFGVQNQRTVLYEVLREAAAMRLIEKGSDGRWRSVE